MVIPRSFGAAGVGNAFPGEEVKKWRKQTSIFPAIERLLPKR